MKVNEIFQSGMVLQQEKEVRIWGEGEPKEQIYISVQGQFHTTECDQNGKWIIILNPLKISQEEILVIQGKEKKIELTDIAVGEVWIAGGQSNMEFIMRYEKHYSDEVKKCQNRNIRFYDTPKISFEKQREAFDYSKVGKWRKATAEDLEYFSAVGYYFEKGLNKELNVPIGIVGCNWGGTSSSVWMSEESVKKNGVPWYEEYLKTIETLDINAYWEKQLSNPMNDTGNAMDSEFNRFILPNTPSDEEIDQFFEGSEMELEALGEFQPNCIPGCLYEHMVKRIAPFTTRGVLWYQGESDDIEGRQTLYEGMLRAVIEDWRSVFKDQELPFLIVQLPGFREWMGLQDFDFQMIRQCQQKVADSVENTWLCSISDIGEEWDIHPKDKETVGKRLLLSALGHVYRRDILCDAPNVKEYNRTANQIEISFYNAGEGLQVSGNHKIKALKLYKEKQEIVYEFKVEKDRIVLSFAETTEPIQVEFAQTAWYKVNLYNSAKIPAVPFQILC